MQPAMPPPCRPPALQPTIIRVGRGELGPAEAARAKARYHVPGFEEVDIAVLRSCFRLEFAESLGERLVC